MNRLRLKLMLVLAAVGSTALFGCHRDSASRDKKPEGTDQRTSRIELEVEIENHSRQSRRESEEAVRASRDRLEESEKRHRETMREAAWRVYQATNYTDTPLP